MLTDAERRNYERYEKIAFKLNHDTYLEQIKKQNKALKQFLPCEKALVFTSAMGRRPIPVTMQVIPLAAQTNCGCHMRLDEKALFDLFYQLSLPL